MTDQTATPCDWCRRPGATHTEDQHPLPRDHADYDAFYDATDAELTAMTVEALRSSGSAA
jgi:hypothetical protein